jgi:hypothetical protein
MSTNAQIENSIAKALQLEALVKKDRTKLEGRLSAGVIDGFFADSGTSQNTSAGAVIARQSKRAATLSQEDQIAMLSIFVQAVRTAGKQNHLPGEILADLGVGKTITKSVKSVTDAASLVIHAYEAHVDELRRVGVLPADIERITELRDRLSSTNKDQEGRKLSSKDQTKIRNEAHKRLLEAMALIIGAAELAFASDPEHLELYRALRPSKSSAKKPAAPQA